MTDSPRALQTAGEQRRKCRLDVVFSAGRRLKSALMPGGSQENEKVTGHVDRRQIIDGFAEVRTHAARVGTSTIIDLGAAASGTAGKDVLTLPGFRLARLEAADFLLAR